MLKLLEHILRVNNSLISFYSRRVSTALFSLTAHYRTARSSRVPYLAPVRGGGPRRAGGHRMALAFDRRPSKASAMCKKHNPGSGRLTCVFKVCLDGKKRQHPLEEGNQSAHTGTLEVHFGAALGLAGSNKMLSVLPH